MTKIAQKHTQSTPSVEIAKKGEVIQVSWPDQIRSRFHAVWLRDNGQDDFSRDPKNQQKLKTVLDIPADTYIDSACVSEGNRVDLLFGPDRWKTHIDLNWLREHRYDVDQCPNSRLICSSQTTWDQELNNHIPTVNYGDCQTDPNVLLNWLQSIDKLGIAKITELPKKSTVVLDVIALFGYVRETNYGRYFEIRSELNPINLANTSRGLQVHSDNPYRDPVPTLQFFGCLENDAEGGESIVVDSFRAAEILKQTDPDSFDILTQHSAEFDFQGDNDAHLHASRPMIECSPEGQLQGVRFNNRSCHGFTKIPFDKMKDFYSAYRKFAEIIDSKRLQVSFKLQPGALFVVDNTRVLHGRKGFSGSGNRWMQGAYADKDSLQSKIRILKKSLNNNG